MRGSLPRLMKLYEKYKAYRDRFEILTFHDATVETFEELDEKLERRIANDWDGKPLPFPIFLDPTRQTIDAFGISAYPTTLLLDPEGRVVRGGGEKMLEQTLEEMAAGDDG